MTYKIGRCDYELIGTSPLIVITGTTDTVVFCNEVRDLIRQGQTGEIWTCDTLAEFEERARYPAFLGRWWYSGSADKLSLDDSRAFQKLLKKPVTYGTAVLTGLDFTKYRMLTRDVRQHKQIHELSASFPSRRFLVAYIKRGVELRGGKISQGAAESFMWRMGEEYSRYETYLDRLIAELPKGKTEAKPEHVRDTLKGVTGASFDDFVKYLVKPLTNNKLRRSTKLFKCYQCMLEDGAAKTLRRLHNRALQYMEIRRLINEGFIPANVESSVESLRKLLGPRPERNEEDEKQKFRKFTCWDILAWNDIKFKLAVSLAASVSLSDWFEIVRLSAKPCSTDEEAERVFYDILTRSVLSGESS
ncbi:hypothetical protein FACS1894208_02150 [Clostridia bacterium]|nr:hypothetical protein FACS1894208_02150 [Clostridia bacterium]